MAGIWGNVSNLSAAMNTPTANVPTGALSRASSPAPAPAPVSSGTGGGGGQALTPQGTSAGQYQPFPQYQPQATAFPAVQQARLRTAEELAALYGIDYNKDNIASIFKNAVQAEYNQLRKAFDATSNTFYDKLYGTQATALDTIRKSNASAVATGASRGMQAANELSAMLGIGQQGVASATELAQQGLQLNDKEATSLAQAEKDAFDTSTKIKQALSTLASNVYGADTQFNVADLQAWATKYNAEKNLEAAGVTSEATKAAAQTAANANIEVAGMQTKSNERNTDAQIQGNKDTAGITAWGNITAAGVSGWYNKTGQIEVAKINQDTQKYAADLSSKTGIKVAEIQAEATKAAQKAYADAMVSSANINATAAKGSQPAQPSFQAMLESYAKQNTPGAKAAFMASLAPAVGAEQAEKTWNAMTAKTIPDTISSADISVKSPVAQGPVLPTTPNVGMPTYSGVANGLQGTLNGIAEKIFGPKY